ncbi:MAG: hypothetical protein IIA87_00515 [Nanoarchaeota archaeon]|nr:hypothetical protein [Nanoarchaeota archaeon]
MNEKERGKLYTKALETLSEVERILKFKGKEIDPLSERGKITKAIQGIREFYSIRAKECGLFSEQTRRELMIPVTLNQGIKKEDVKLYGH